MKLSTALNEKNRLTRKIKEIETKIEMYNSYIKGDSPTYDISELLDELKTSIDQLISLKTRIAEANQAVQSKIFKLSELKSFASFLRRLNIKEGKVLDQNWNSEVREWESELSIKERDMLIEKTEKQIASIQMDLDKFNFETSI